VKVWLSRFLCTDVESNFARMDREAARAVHAGAELIVYPESFLHGYTRKVDSQVARERFKALSCAHLGRAFVFGSLSEHGHNRMTVWQDGVELAAYDKVHLFAPNGEFEIWSPGDRYVSVKVNGWTLGLINCNDLRFPEQARALRLQGGADVLVVVAWWPWRRTHIFETLLRARAIENGCFVVGCCIDASETEGEDFRGAGNYAFDPLGDPIHTQEEHLYTLDRNRPAAVLVDPRTQFVDIARVDRY